MADRQNITPFPGIDMARFRSIFPRAGMTDRDALRLIVRNGDVLDVEGGLWLLVAMPEELADHLAALDAEADDMEPDNEDCCEAHDDDLRRCCRGNDYGPGDPGDAEDDGTAEEWLQPACMPGGGSGPAGLAIYAKGEAVR